VIRRNIGVRFKEVRFKKMGMVNKIYRSRAFQDGDETALISLYRHVTGRPRTLTQYRWEWLEPPEGRGSIWIIENSKNNEVVGHHGLIPIRLSCFGQSVFAGKTENTMVHPSHQGKLLYPMFEKKFMAEAKARFELLYTTMGSGTPGKIRKYLGYFPVGAYVFYLQISRKAGLDRLARAVVGKKVKNKFISRIALYGLKFLNCFLILLFPRRRPVDPSVQLNKVEDIDGFAKELDALWQRTRTRLGMTISRKSDYLKWRLFENPNVPYDFYAATRSGRMVGYAAVKHGEEGEAAIVDLLADNNETALFDAILQGILKKLEEQKIDLILFPTLISRNSINTGLKRNGFRSLSSIMKLYSKIAKYEEPILLVKIFNEELDETKISNPENWYFTGIFGEGLRHTYSLIRFLSDS
jgi:hypothetical protein